jgi:hypothetical protein
MKDVSGMTSGELAELLSKLTEELEDVEEERRFVISQTGLHVSAGAVRKYDTEIDNLRARIEEVKKLVHAKKVE